MPRAIIQVKEGTSGLVSQSVKSYNPLANPNQVPVIAVGPKSMGSTANALMENRVLPVRGKDDLPALIELLQALHPEYVNPHEPDFVFFNLPLDPDE